MESTETKMILDADIQVTKLDKPKRGTGGHPDWYEARTEGNPLVGRGGTELQARKELRYLIGVEETLRNRANERAS